MAANSCREGGAGKGEERSCLTLSGQYLGKTDDVAAESQKKEENLLTTFVQSVSLLGIAFQTSPYRTFNGQR